MKFDYNRLYLTTDGRIGRQDFWLGILGFFVVGLVVSLIISAVFGLTSFPARLLNFILQLVFAYPSYALFAKRFQDRDKPGNYGWILVGAGVVYGLLGLLGLYGDPIQPNAIGTVLGLIVGLIAIWFLVELGILRGTAGQNQYGPNPVGP